MMSLGPYITALCLASSTNSLNYLDIPLAVPFPHAIVTTVSLYVVLLFLFDSAL